jgi:hypothetical protein
MKAILIVLALQCTFIANSQIPQLNSSPGTPAVLFLDFDGHTVISGVWNNGSPLNCQHPNIGTAVIIEAFNRVAEDYKIFKINVTTDSTVFLSAPLTQRSRIIITPSNFMGTGTGGVAYMGSFSWGDDTPGFVFADSNANAKFLGEAISHESGHTLGCAHQSVYNIYCDKISEYNSGQGDGQTGWAPIMGYSVDRQFTTWNNDKRSISCDNQDDIAIIANRIVGGGLVTDDIANTPIGAANLDINNTVVLSNGIINNSTDVDVFKMTVSEPTVVKLNITPPVVNNNINLGNLDVLAKLINSSGTVIRTYNITDSLNVRIDTTLNQGEYYISVEGVGNSNSNSDYGSTGGFSIKGTVQTVISLPLYSVTINGSTHNDRHVIQWNISADEPVIKRVIEYSVDGIQFNTLQTVSNNTGSYSYIPFSNNTIYYRCNASIRNGASKVSNVLALQSNRQQDRVKILNNRVNDQLLISSKETVFYQVVDANGRVVNNGKLLSQSMNTINTITLARGLYFVRLFNANFSESHRIIKE